MLKWLDGKKRYLLLLIYVLQTLAQMGGQGDVGDVIKGATSAVGFEASDTFVDGTLLVQLLASIWAIVDGWRKDRAARARVMR